MEPVELFERAAIGAVAMVGSVRDDQRGAPTPCAEWDVDELVGHMMGGTAYLLGVTCVDEPPPTTTAEYRTAVDRCLSALREPGMLDRRCASPAGFEWSVAEAAAGTAMDQLVHTWDLAVAIGGDPRLDPELVDAVVAMFLPQMPEVGREAGIVGAAVLVPEDAPAQDRLLAAMGRRS